MKSTKNCNGTKCKSTKSKSNKSKANKNSQESSTDPDGSYTGNPIGFGRYEMPVQDADDL